MPFGLGLSVCNNPLAYLYRDTQGNVGHKVLLLVVFLEQQPGLQQSTRAKMGLLSVMSQTQKQGIMKTREEIIFNVIPTVNYDR